jgi:hypothetical protein
VKYYYVDRDDPFNFSINRARYALLSDSNGQMDSYEIWNNSDNLKKLLLYFPSIAVLDPVDELLSLSAEYPPTLTKILHKLLPFRPLIDKRIIELVPGVTGYQTVIEQINFSYPLKNILKDDNIFEAFKIYDPGNYNSIVSSKLDLPGFSLTNEEREVIILLERKNIPRGLLIWAAIILKGMYVRFRMSDLIDSNIAIVSKKRSGHWFSLI